MGVATATAQVPEHEHHDEKRQAGNDGLDVITFDIEVAEGDTRTITERLPTIDMRWIDDITK